MLTLIYIKKKVISHICSLHFYIFKIFFIPCKTNTSIFFKWIVLIYPFSQFQIILEWKRIFESKKVSLNERCIETHEFYKNDITIIFSTYRTRIQNSCRTNRSPINRDYSTPTAQKRKLRTLRNDPTAAQTTRCYNGYTGRDNSSEAREVYQRQGWNACQVALPPFRPFLRNRENPK